MKKFIILVINPVTYAFDILHTMSTMIHNPEVYEGDTQGSIKIFYQ